MNKSRMQTNAEFAKTDQEFRDSCRFAMPPKKLGQLSPLINKRQASKFRNHKGIAYKIGMKKVKILNKMEQK